MTFRAAIFDVDGVLVDSPHERAWRDSFAELMDTEWADVREESTYTPERFTADVYHQVMSGKPRMSGALAVLDYFQVPDAENRVQAYADRKQALVRELIGRGEFRAYPDALRFILAVKYSGIPVAAASSSKNAQLFLERIYLDVFVNEHGLPYSAVKPGLTLLDLFDVNLSGQDFKHGKPHPMMFLAVAEELGVKPEWCVVMEDAVSGIQAAKAGGMTALGVSRADDEDALARAGADRVVTSLDDVSVSALHQGSVELATIR
ncbi:HAD-IA family hydrolase [Ruania alkalisoli]|uniref:HAD-IA family hydrolase n=1 Tax=Ruania alkalisoli TaxID=2779775 RepID=A0A7M1STV0_9MICO|nr:HAD-IA family hydrolase [Ruania alkalisoli]QOR70467.1 HAD-IA family hydrolase [Ruania alkalisoli]